MQYHVWKLLEGTLANWSLMLQAFATDPTQGDPSPLLVAARKVALQRGDAQELLQFMLPHLTYLTNADMQVFARERFMLNRAYANAGIRLTHYWTELPETGPGTTCRALALRLKSTVFTEVRDIALAVVPLLGTDRWHAEVHDGVGVELLPSMETIEATLDGLSRAAVSARSTFA